MSNTPVQPDYEKVMQEFHAWVRRRCSYEVIDPDPNKPRIDFIAERDMRQYFAEDDHRRLTEIIRAFFPNDDTICAEDIYPEKLAVFCTLLRISKGPWIEHFRHYDTLSDTKLPFSPTKPPEDWPEDPDDHEFLQKFCQAQWKFHVPIMQRPFRGKQFKKEQILPIISKTALNTGSSGNLWLIKVHPDYNQLITDDEKKRLGDDANTFVLKEYFTSDAEKYYNAEVNAFRRLGSTSSIIGFRGSFARGDCLNLILEWADKKTLEDYFRDVQPPADGEEIIQFWEALSKIIDALMKIHCAKPDDAGGGRIILGWHQDVKPANILVVSNGCNNPREWQFKLADLGTSHFNRVDQLRRNSTATNTQGTRTYGAPECCSPDNVSENDQLRVGQNVDIWSLGCIYSEAARWLKDGYQGILGYRRERSEETSRVADFEDADCFHNGERVLESVRASHRKSTKSLRQEDFITKPVIDHLVRDMLQDAVARPTALVLAHKSKQLFQEARQNLEDANRPPTTPLPDRKARRFQTVPTPGPPPPPKLPLGEAAFPGLMNFVAMPQTPEGSSNPHLTKSNLLTPTSLPDDDDEQQSQSPDEITDFNDDTPTKRPASYSNQHQPEPRATRRRSLVRSFSLRKRGRQPTESVDETATGRSIKSDTSDVTLPTGNGTRASNDQATNRYSTGHGLGLSSSGTKRVSVPPSTGHGPSYLANNQGGQNDAKIPAHHRREDSNNSLSFLTLPSGQRSPSPCENKHRQAPPPIVIQRQTEPPTAPPATWTIQEALKWKKDKKNTNKPIPNPDLLNRLKGREHVFLVDDSLSMNPHWENVLEVFEALSYIVKTADPNGLDLHFTVSEDNCLNCQETTALIRMVRNRIRRSTTDMNIRLTALLQAYQKKLSKKRLLFSATVRPMNLYILTDGVWEAETNVEDPIRSLVQTLNEKRMGRLQVGIQFIYFGNNQRALERLEHLDSRLGLDPDIVDHESANGNVWKMLFGSTNATFDSVNENRSSVMSTPTDRSRSPTMSDKEYK